MRLSVFAVNYFFHETLVKSVFNILFVILVSHLPLLAGGNDSGSIPWEADRKLTWDDFKGPPNEKTSFLASTAYAIDCETQWVEAQLVFRVQCSMQPNVSWVKPGAASEYLLSHEQLHFDIAELYARKLRAEISTTDFATKTLNKILKEITDKNSRERETAQRRYDQETRHSLSLIHI